MGEDVVIRVERLWKRYGFPLKPALRGLAQAVKSRRFAQTEDDGPWALRDISFEVRRGETLGIIGRNGAGKSTLLKVLAGVSQPTAGRVEVRGEVFPMIELNAGIHPELTGRENVCLLAAIMGLSRREIDSKMPEIEEFCELGDWFDRPVRTYSSGMLARLGFGVAINVQSDVLLVDEVLAVGDLQFQNRCLARMREMRENGATVILVSHNPDVLQYLSKTVVLLEKGCLLAVGSAPTVVRSYETLVFARERDGHMEHGTRGRISSGEIWIESARVLTTNGQQTRELNCGEPFVFEFVFDAKESIEAPLFSVGILDARGVLCMGNLSDEDGYDLPTAYGRQRLTVYYRENHLAPGAYEVNIAIRDRNSFETFERIASVASFSVVGQRRARGLISNRCGWELDYAKDTDGS